MLQKTASVFQPTIIKAVRFFYKSDAKLVFAQEHMKLYI